MQPPEGPPLPRNVALGWSRDLELSLSPETPSSLLPSRVVARVVEGGRPPFHLLTEEGSRYLATCRSHVRDVVVGDWVVAENLVPGHAVIERVLPRKSELARVESGTSGDRQALASNVDRALIVTGADRERNLRRLERYLALVRGAGVEAVLVLTKIDMVADPEPLLAEMRTIAPGVLCLAASSVAGMGLETVAGALVPGETHVLLGSSGVGKSSLANRLIGGDELATGPVRARDDKGRHTTSGRRLLRLPNGALLIDTPGMRELALTARAGSGLAATFPELGELAATCRFRDCTHGDEPGCAISEAVEAGELDPARVESWDKLRRELDLRARKERHRARRQERRQERRDGRGSRRADPREDWGRE